MGWEKLMPFRGKRARLFGMHVSIHKTGRLYVSQDVKDAVGDLVVLLYDSDTNRMALRSTDNEKEGYRLVAQGKGFIVTLVKFIRHFELGQIAGRYVAELQDGMLVIDLNENQTQI